MPGHMVLTKVVHLQHQLYEDNSAPWSSYFIQVGKEGAGQEASLILLCTYE